MLKTKVWVLAIANGKAKVVCVGCLRFLDGYKFLSVSLDNNVCMPVIKYYEYNGIEGYSWNLVDLRTEDFSLSLTENLPSKEHYDNFNKEFRQKMWPTTRTLKKISIYWVIV